MDNRRPSRRVIAMSGSIKKEIRAIRIIAGKEIHPKFVCLLHQISNQFP